MEKMDGSISLFVNHDDAKIKSFLSDLSNSQVKVIGPELIFKSLHSTILKYQKRKLSLKKPDTLEPDSQGLDLEEINRIVSKYSSRNIGSLNERELNFKNILQNTVEAKTKSIERKLPP